MIPTLRQSDLTDYYNTTEVIISQIGLTKRRDHEDLCAETLCIRYLTYLQFSLCILDYTCFV